jgi:hypothetical protein
MAKAKKKLSKSAREFLEVSHTFQMFCDAINVCAAAQETPEAFADYIMPDDADGVIDFLQRIHGVC